MEPIVLSSDEDDQDLDRPTKYRRTEGPQRLPTSGGAATESSGASSVLGLDRKQMELERLARLAKRNAAASEPATTERRLGPHPGPTTATATGSESVPYHVKERPEVKQSAAKQSAATSDAEPKSAAPGAGTAQANAPYPRGCVRRSWSFGTPRGNDIKIEEVFQKNQLELAVLSSFQWDEEWLMSKLDMSRTKLILIAFAASEAEREAMRANVPREKIRFCFPPMTGGGFMHSKLQLLKFPGYLRLVVPTGNLVPYDWGENGLLENMVFLIDLPRLDTGPSDGNVVPSSPFRDDLSAFLRALTVDEKLVKSLVHYDFSQTAGLRFVHSISGYHVGNAIQQTGYYGLSRAVSSLGLQTEEPLAVDVVCSSLGSATYEFLANIYEAIAGMARIPTTGTASGLPVGDKQRRLIDDNMRVFFPSESTILKSRGGKNAAGTVCFRRKWWDSKHFPRNVLRDFEPSRPGLILHSKLIVSRHVEDAGGPGWAYIGSANLTESAWGRILKQRGQESPRLLCRNWECGVLIPISSVGSTPSAGADAMTNGYFLDFPVKLPGWKYGDEGQATPWFFTGE